MTQFLTSRAGSPAPFRPVRSNTLTDEDLQAIEQLSASIRNLDEEQEKKNAAEVVQQQKADLEKLEKEVQQL
jgi:2-isopropylmalate synthase